MQYNLEIPGTTKANNVSAGPLPIRVLIIDDDEDDFIITREYISNIQGQQFSIEWCYTYDEAIKLICDRSHHIYLVDYRLGARTGLELIEECIKQNCEEPFVLLTGNGNRELDLKAMQTGAVDYLVKGDLTTEKLERCIRYSLERSASISALRANERKFRNIFERSKDMIFIADEELFFKDVNEAATQLFEYGKSELLSNSLYFLLANAEEQQAVKFQLEVEGDVFDKEVEIFTKKGDRKYCSLTLSKEKDISNRFYVQGILHDITSLKRAERATIQAEKLGVTSRLLRILAHEVRNPLNNINLSVEQLEPELTTADANLYLDIIDRNSKRIGDLITELLDSSRQGEIALEKRSLTMIIEESLVAANDRLTLKHIRVEKTIPAEEAWIMADADKLKIALLNIIINAIEAMEEDKGVLTVSLKKQQSQYVVIVEDNGSGISEEQLPHLFEPYFTSKRNGMGLGLASTLNIIQSHRAVIDVQSAVGKGTTFRLLFDNA